MCWEWRTDMKNLKNPREKNVILDKSRQLPTQAAYEMILAKFLVQVRPADLAFVSETKI